MYFSWMKFIGDLELWCILETEIEMVEAKEFWQKLIKMLRCNAYCSFPSTVGVNGKIKTWICLLGSCFISFLYMLFTLFLHFRWKLWVLVSLSTLRAQRSRIRQPEIPHQSQGVGLWERQWQRTHRILCMTQASCLEYECNVFREDRVFYALDVTQEGCK